MIRYWDELEGLVGVKPVGTDFGHCCKIVPQIAFNPTEEMLGLNEGDNGVRPGSGIGERNGLKVILDGENYNIGNHRIKTQGFKVALHDHKLETNRIVITLSVMSAEKFQRNRLYSIFPGLFQSWILMACL